MSGFNVILKNGEVIELPHANTYGIGKIKGMIDFKAVSYKQDEYYLLLASIFKDEITAIISNTDNKYIERFLDDPEKIISETLDAVDAEIVEE